MKIAVLYAGQIRTWNRVRENQYQNLGHDVDRFFYTNEKPDSEYKQFVKCPDVSYYPNKMSDYDSNKNPITQLHGSLNQWHNLFVGFCLVPNEYDVICKSRCDIELSGKIDFSQYEMKDDTVYIPEGNDHCGGVNDQFCIGNYQSMKKYFSVYLEHQNLFAKGITFHTERYTTENLKAKGVNIVRLNITNSIVR